MRHTRKILAVAAAGVIAFAIGACSGHGQTGLQKEHAQQAQDFQSLVNNQPLPHVSWSQERQILIDAETAAANGTQSTSFFFVQGVRDPIFVCPSEGLGVPDTAQLSNPTQIAPISGKYGGGATVLDQADPFGVYSPPNSMGTYVICIGANGKPYLHRGEEFVHTILAPAHWDYVNHTIVVTGAPSYTVKTKR